MLCRGRLGWSIVVGCTAAAGALQGLVRPLKKTLGDFQLLLRTNPLPDSELAKKRKVRSLKIKLHSLAEIVRLSAEK